MIVIEVDSGTRFYFGIGRQSRIVFSPRHEPRWIRPDRFHAMLASALAAEEASEVRDQAHHLVEFWIRRLLDFDQQVGAPGFRPEQRTPASRSGAAQSHQVRQRATRG